MRDFRSTVACLLGPGLGLWLSLGLGALSSTALAADVAISPPAGGGFSVTDASGNNPRLRVQESGAVSVPGLPSAAQQDTPQCFNSSTGTLGPCAPTASFSASQIQPVYVNHDCTHSDVVNGLTLLYANCPANRYLVSGGCMTSISGNNPVIALSLPTRQNPGDPLSWYCNFRCYDTFQTVTAAALCAP